MFTLTFNTDNDAFQDGNMNAEIGRILMNVCRQIDAGVTKAAVRDVNGNTVGDWILSDD